MEKEESAGLSQFEAEKLLAIPKKVIVKDKPLDMVALNFNESNDIR